MKKKETGTMTFVCQPDRELDWYIWIDRGGALYWGKANDHRRWAIAAIWRSFHG